MTTEPFADQQPATSTSQPAHWHVFADGPGTGPGFVFGGSTDAPLDEDGAHPARLDAAVQASAEGAP